MYQNGKIYKLVSAKTDKIYIGSTCNPLYKRLWQHKSASKNLNKCYTAKELVKFDDCKIILIEDFPCERKEQLTARERYHIEQNIHICVNKGIPTRTIKEWYQQNKDKIAEHMKEYYEQNKDTIAQQKKEYYEQNKDKKVEYNKEYYEQNKDKIAQQKKEYNEKNKDKIAQRRRLRRLEKNKIEPEIKEDGTAI